MRKRRIGKIEANGVRFEKHEYDTVMVLAKYGYDVEGIPKSYTKGQRTADILVDGVVWEMKSPEGKGKKTLERILTKARRQSSNVIVDLRRCPLAEGFCVKELTRVARLKKQIKRLRVIKKNGELLDIK